VSTSRSEPTSVTETTNVSDKHEELFTRIALDNKLLTKFQLKKALDEQERRAKEDGKRPPIGDVLKALGFLTERQYQSVENAQRYREQRDFDKRFGRQVLRMQLLDQAKVEAALEDQKQIYSKSGNVQTLAEVLVEKKLLTAAQAEEVKRQIELRDKKKTAGGPALKPSTKKPEEDEDSMKLADIEEDAAPAPVLPKAEEGEDEEEDEEEDEDDEDEDGEDEEDDDEDEDDEEDEDEEDEDEADEEDLAEAMDELPDADAVELDAKDLETIEELESTEEEADKGWAADAFDDRPLAKRQGDGSSDQRKPLPKDAKAEAAKPEAAKLETAKPAKPEPAKPEKPLAVTTPSSALPRPTSPPVVPKPPARTSERVAAKASERMPAP